MQTKIQSIAFYRGCASVTRTGKPDGATVVIENLPVDAVETLDITADGGSVVSCKTERRASASEKTAALKAAWDAAEQAVERNAMEMEFYRQNLKVDGGMAALDGAFDFFNQRFTRILAEKTALRAAADTAKKQYETAAKQAADRTATATVQLSGKPTALTVRYVTHTAGWNMQREVHTDGKGDLCCRLKAIAYNNGGEDFADVSAMFSTAEADAFAVLPTFSPDYIGRPVHARVMTRAAAPMMLANDVCECEPIEAETDVDVTYTLDAATVRAGDTATLLLKEETVPATYEYVAPTYGTQKAFFAARAARPLESGVVRVYYNGRALGETAISSDENPLFGLGVADRITVKREQGKQFTEQKLLKGEHTEYRYTVTVRNDRAETVAVHVVDRVPVSTDKSITVEVGEHSGAKYDAETGRLDWEMTLRPGAKSVFAVSYTVKNNN